MLPEGVDRNRMKGRTRLLLFLSLPIIFFAFAEYVAFGEDQEKGTLSVMTTPVSGAIYVDQLLKGKKFWSGDLGAGYHVVTFGDVRGYITPSPQTVTVIANQLFHIIGLYKKLPTD